jgi:hypothetical protein
VNAGAQQRDALVLLAPSGDTISVERLLRSATRLESDLRIKAAGARFTFSVTIAPDGGATSFENAYRLASASPDSPPLQRASVRFTADSALADISGGAGTTTQRFATRPGVVPFLSPSMALAELIIRRGRAIGGDSVQVPIWLVQGGTTMLADVVAIGRDSVRVAIGGIPIHVAISGSGDVTGGVIPSQGLRIVRVRDGMPTEVVPRPDYTAPAGAPYTAEQVRIPTSMGHTLAGTLTLPSGAGLAFPSR